MSSRLTFEDIQLGQQWTSDRRTITEADVINFANMTGDFNPLHVNHEFARESLYRRPIAHGLLGMAWVAGLGSTSPAVDTVAFVAVRNWEFVKPLFFGDTVHVLTEVVQLDASGRRTGRVVWSQRLINQRDEVTQQGTFETLVRRVAELPKPHLQGAPATGQISKRDSSIQS